MGRRSPDPLSAGSGVRGASCRRKSGGSRSADGRGAVPALVLRWRWEFRGLRPRCRSETGGQFSRWGPLPRAMPVHSRTRFRGPPGRCANRKSSTERLYRGQLRYCFGDWLARPLDAISRRDVEARFHLVSRRHGRATGNHAISLLRSVYRRPCVDYDGLRNPVELWLAGGGRYHPSVRRRISAPSEVLPRWRRGIEAEVNRSGDPRHLLARDIHRHAGERGVRPAL